MRSIFKRQSFAHALALDIERQVHGAIKLPNQRRHVYHQLAEWFDILACSQMVKDTTFVSTRGHDGISQRRPQR